MKISLFIKGINGITGGAERSILDLALALASASHQVEVVTMDKELGVPFYSVPECKARQY